jgi:hypothetical protein
VDGGVVESYTMGRSYSVVQERRLKTKGSLAAVVHAAALSGGEGRHGDAAIARARCPSDCFRAE